MCRLAAYLGPAISLNQLLIKPSHSLYRQSWQPKEMQEAVCNVDGFGFGWLTPTDQITRYTNTCPIWHDSNLTALSISLFSRYWLANVRSATINLQINQADIQPFMAGQLLFTHNGYINNFDSQIRTHFHRILQPSIQTDIRGNTDSEYIFALLRQQLTEVPDLAQAMLKVLATLQQICAEEKMLLNLIIADNNKFYLLRHAINGDCPSLYYTIAEDDFPNSILIASEPMTESNVWQPVPPHSYAVISDNQQPLFISL